MPNKREHDHKIYRLIERKEINHRDHECYCWTMSPDGIEEPNTDPVIVMILKADDELQAMIPQHRNHTPPDIAEFIYYDDQQFAIMEITETPGRFTFITTRISGEDIPFDNETNIWKA